MQEPPISSATSCHPVVLGLDPAMASRGSRRAHTSASETTTICVRAPRLRCPRIAATCARRHAADTSIHLTTQLVRGRLRDALCADREHVARQRSTAEFGALSAARRSRCCKQESRSRIAGVALVLSGHTGYARCQPPPAANQAARSIGECGSSRGAVGGGFVAVPVGLVRATPTRTTVHAPSREGAIQLASGSDACLRLASAIASSRVIMKSDREHGWHRRFSVVVLPSGSPKQREHHEQNAKTKDQELGVAAKHCEPNHNEQHSYEHEHEPPTNTHHRPTF